MNYYVNMDPMLSQGQDNYSSLCLKLGYVCLPCSLTK
jgi:hypothetical protein